MHPTTKRAHSHPHKLAWAMAGQYLAAEQFEPFSCRRYYDEGADEVTFLNITGFRECPLHDLPMLQVR
eukprot:scaffold138561_cov33-Tisochrysis_lutea.AAC.2